MTRVILLDSGPLGGLVHTARSAPIDRWVRRRTRTGTRVLVPAITYYELRRELARLRLADAVRNLDEQLAVLGFAPITVSVLTRASELWAEARRQGRPSADARSLDVDVVLAATGLDIVARGHDVIVATYNLRHPSQYLPAARWEDITR